MNRLDDSSDDHSPAQPSLLIPEWRAPGNVRVLTTTRNGGISQDPFASFNLAMHVGDDPRAVRANRQQLLQSAGLPAEPLWLEQVHGTDVVVHDGSHAAGTVPRADAAVAFEPGRVCAVMTADCLPVVFADVAGTRVGIAHAGWRGLAGGVLEATIAALGSDPGTLLAWLGPAISQRAFEVGPEVRDAFLALHEENAACFLPNAGGRFQADLYQLARDALQRAGVRSVSGGDACTSSDAGNFFSYRRDGSTGRMATLAWLEPVGPARTRVLP